MVCRTPATTASVGGGDATPTPTVGLQRQSWRENMLFDTVARLLDRECLASDAHMARFMKLSNDNRVCIPVNLLLTHPVVSGLFMSPEDLMRQLMHLVDNDLLEVDEVRGLVYPLMKAKRRTLIIRNPQDSEDAYRRFLLDKCPYAARVEREEDFIVDVRTVLTPYSKDIYITLRTQQLAADVALWLMTAEYTPGKRLQVAIKNESQYSACQLLPNFDRGYPAEYMIRPAYPVGGPETPPWKMRSGRSSPNRGRKKQTAVAPPSRVPDAAEFPPLGMH